MQRLTPQQFFEQNFTTPTFEKPGGEAFGRLQSEIERLMQAYAEHLEKTAWVDTDYACPDKTDVYRVLIVDDAVTPNDHYVVNAIYHSGKRVWKSIYDNQILYPKKWHVLPQMPK